MNGEQVDSVEYLDSDETSIYLVITRGIETLLMVQPRRESEGREAGDDAELYE